MRQINRREFLAGASLAAGLGAAPLSFDSKDPIASAPPAQWAAGELAAAIEERKVSLNVVAAGRSAALSRLSAAGVSLPDTPEALAIVPGADSVLACGSDVRGLVYALLELADRVRLGQPAAGGKPMVEKPANRVRSIARAFVSDVEDKPWFYDRAYWREYLTMIAAQRFNRFNLAFGIGYDYTYGEVRDVYFHFTYPFLVSVPGYEVRIAGLADEERDRNLDTLRFIAEETAARGLEFQLGLWNHAYIFDSPMVSHRVEGLTAENHAAYCRDALRLVLEKCPTITGLTIRTHGEGGIPEGAYEFWRTIFEGAARSGRRVGIDLHAKGISQKMIDTALSTGLPITVSPKFWAEHMGLPYHQAAIRALEAPRAEGRGIFTLSEGPRNFTRYGYADLLNEDRRYRVLNRIWPGTQRLLLWGDPLFASATARAMSFCGADGAEVHEPLFFKGRKGSGLPGGRTGYADASLVPRYDFEKYLYTYRLWGRLLYNPSTDPEVWRRLLRAKLGAAAPNMESTLARAGRLLPLVTTAHCPSAANNNYWPEMYLNQSIVDPNQKHPYGDTPAPKVFGTVSPLDPEIFSGVDEFAGELLRGETGATYSPAEVAAWLDRLASEAALSLAQAPAGDAEFRRASIDAAIQIALGRFFAWKLRSGALWALYDRTGEATALQEALKAYRSARKAWADAAARAQKVYRPDITFGWDANSRGHWSDRLAAIDQDIALMEKRPPSQREGREKVAQAIRAVLNPAPRPVFNRRHTPPANFTPGKPLGLTLVCRDPLASVRLHYRRVNQAEAWKVQDVARKANGYSATIPGDYTASPFPLQYYFELRPRTGAPELYPGLGPELAAQPYFSVRRA